MGGGSCTALEEDIDPEYEPSEQEMLDYAEWLGMDTEEERDLLWIVREALKAPLPSSWRPCKTLDTQEIYYFNFATGESTWDHPCDAYYRNLYEEEKKRANLSKPASGGNNNAKKPMKKVRDIIKLKKPPAHDEDVAKIDNEDNDEDVAEMVNEGNDKEVVKMANEDKGEKKEDATQTRADGASPGVLADPPVSFATTDPRHCKPLPDIPSTARRQAPRLDEGSHFSNASIVLEEDLDPNYEPSEQEMLKYAKWLGMDTQEDRDLLWIAREGLKAPLPKIWKPCKTLDTQEIYYFNFATGESTWDHPCDAYYRNLYEDEKKRSLRPRPSNLAGDARVRPNAGPSHL